MKRLREVELFLSRGYKQYRKTIIADCDMFLNTSYGCLSSNSVDHDTFHALVCEQLDMDNRELTRELRRQWNKRNPKGKSTHVDKCMRACRSSINSVYLSQKQVYFANHLESTLHYSITKKSGLQEIIRIAAREGVHMNEYLPNQDYTDPDNFITVLNTASNVV
jgi:hypothetical protein